MRTLIKIRNELARDLKAGRLPPLMKDIDDAVTNSQGNLRAWRASDERMELKMRLIVLCTLAGAIVPDDVIIDANVAHEMEHALCVSIALHANMRKKHTAILKKWKAAQAKKKKKAKKS